MSRWFRIVPALLLLVALAGAARAQDTLRVCDNFARQTFQDVTLTLQVPQFPYPECTLLSADVRLTIAIDGAHFGENTGNCIPPGCSYVDTTWVDLGLDDLNGNPLDTSTLFATQGLLTGYDGVFDFGGTSGFTAPFAWAPFNNFALTYPNLDYFDNPVVFAVDGTALSHLRGPGNGTFGVRTYIQASLCATYVYACVTPVEPTTWGGIKALLR